MNYLGDNKMAMIGFKSKKEKIKEVLEIVDVFLTAILTVLLILKYTGKK